MNGLPSSPLVTNVVHVVRLPTAAPDDQRLLFEMLDEEEKRRACRFFRAADRRRFVSAHGSLRIVLGRCLGTSAAAVRMHTRPGGKPVLTSPTVDLRFNLSHAGEHVLIALAVAREVGVDIEHERDIDVESLAERCFSLAEQRALQAIDPGDRLAAFLRCWTRKESFVKARGDGLSFPLHTLTVSLDEPGEGFSREVPISCEDPATSEGWMMVTLPVPSAYVAALSVGGTEWALSYWAPTSLWPFMQ
jgi:4'-phosphopantetheinyl transferase